MVEIYRVATYIKIEWEEMARTLDIKNNRKEVLQPEKTSQCSAICNFSTHKSNLKKRKAKRDISAFLRQREISLNVSKWYIEKIHY